MMRTALANSLEQLNDILVELEQMPRQLADNVYREANVGQHIRHVFDHMLAIKLAVEEGVVDYDKRDRGNEVETDRLMASQRLSLLRLWIQTEDFDNCKITVASEIDCESTQRMHFDSNLNREILYVINHTIHHAAHIKLVLAHFGINLPAHIGIAPGTASFNRHSTQDESTPCAH
tara:strand:+ start:480 stop:1007 length:528 start_codon:yes stop_codon:yes gene_type:complete